MFLTKLVSSSVTSSSLAVAISCIALTSTLVACVIEDAPPRRLANDPAPATPTTPAPVGSGNGSGSIGGTPSGDPSSVSPSPILAVVDTDQVMNADPGQGVGVFTEYSAGGKWHVWWTCDTAKSQLQCDVALSVTAASGTISNLDSTALDNGSAQLSNGSRIDAQTTTTTQVHGVRFDTNPGAVITLEATIGGLREGPGPNRSFFFFVQDGKINGGFTGRLTNPLQLQGKTP